MWSVCEDSSTLNAGAQLRMNTRKITLVFIGLLISLCFVSWMVLESTAWARAGGGGSSGSRGSRSFSTPSTPSGPSSSRPFNSPGVTPAPGTFPGANQPSSGWFSRSPFMQGLAGGLAGGLLGTMLFGGSGHASPMGTAGGGGIGLFDIIILGLLGYFGFKFYRRWRRQREAAASFYGDVLPPRTESSAHGAHGTPPADHFYPSSASGSAIPYDDLEGGFDQIRRIDPSFNEESFKELVQDLFFRIQAGWMNRSLEGIDSLLTVEMSEFFKSEFNRMHQQGRINRLENIAVRKVELAEAWQEAGTDYVTVLFTANLLDYSVDDKTNQVVQGDKLNPVKFQEFWTFSRDAGGGSRWRLAAINQPGESLTRH